MRFEVRSSSCPSDLSAAAQCPILVQVEVHVYPQPRFLYPVKTILGPITLPRPPDNQAAEAAHLSTSQAKVSCICQWSGL